MIETIGIVGAGTMGNGIAQVCAAAGLPVVMTDISDAALARGMSVVSSSLERLVNKQKMTDADRQAALARIVTSTDTAKFSTCDLVIEAATESEEVKRKIFQALCPSLRPDAMIATNTSSISITRLASSTDRPERFIGIHFMNPVPKMKLVELVRGIATEDETFEVSKQFVTSLDKTIAVSEDFPGFMVNRILLPMINEAIYTLYEGVANVEAIDTAMRLGAHHPMGPLELADFIGLDVCLAIMNVLHNGLGDPKYRPCPLLRRMVAAGQLGKKSGRGFYEYQLLN